MPETVGLSTKNKMKHLFKSNDVLGINWAYRNTTSDKKNCASGGSEDNGRLGLT